MVDKVNRCYFDERNLQVIESNIYTTIIAVWVRI